jgi:hypothetical protein
MGSTKKTLKEMLRDKFADDFSDLSDEEIDEMLREGLLICPRCDSEDWEYLYYNVKEGVPTSCSECRNIEKH